MCRVRNQYGELEREVNLTVDSKPDSTRSHVREELAAIMRKQMSVYSALAR